MPTLLDLLGVEPSHDAEGRSLVGAIAAATVAPAREAFSQARLAPAMPLTPTSDVTPKLAVRDDRFTVLWRKAIGKLELYDRSNDPGEKHNLFSGAALGPEEKELRASLVRRLQGRLEAARAGVKPEPEVISPGIRTSLERKASRQAPARTSQGSR
jgi:arylsulfatase A-like enzyme